MFVRKSVEADFAAILGIVNDAARIYRGVIPAARWHEPYMSTDELGSEIAQGVVFWVAEQDGLVSGVKNRDALAQVNSHAALIHNDRATPLTVG